VVLETAPQADQAALRAARAADLVIVPVRPTIVDIDYAVAAQGRERADARAVIVSRGGAVAATSLGDRKAFRTAFNDGRAAQGVDPGSKAAAEIVALGPSFTFLQPNTATRHRGKRWPRKRNDNSTIRLV
jgi:chromosome partitioning protein